MSARWRVSFCLLVLGGESATPIKVALIITSVQHKLATRSHEKILELHARNHCRLDLQAAFQLEDTP